PPPSPQCPKPAAPVKIRARTDRPPAPPRIGHPLLSRPSLAEQVYCWRLVPVLGRLAGLKRGVCMNLRAWCFAVVCALPFLTAWADTRAPDGAWKLLAAMPGGEQAREPWIRANRFQAAHLDMDAMKQQLSFAPMERTPEANAPARITLPTPAGGFETFEIV